MENGSHIVVQCCYVIIRNAAFNANSLMCLIECSQVYMQASSWATWEYAAMQCNAKFAVQCNAMQTLSIVISSGLPAWPVYRMRIQQTHNDWTQEGPSQWTLQCSLHRVLSIELKPLPTALKSAQFLEYISMSVEWEELSLDIYFLRSQNCISRGLKSVFLEVSIVYF